VGASENKALVKRFYDEVWNKGNVHVADEIFASDYLRHDHRSSRALSGPSDFQQEVSDFRSAFPDLRLVVDVVVGEDELVTVGWTATGVHLGTWGELEPTGLRIDFAGVDIFRFEHGQIAEIWNHRDDLGLMEQAGPPLYVSARPDI
jgi:steroid delta-isomerase-like uncharacterized protein